MKQNYRFSFGPWNISEGEDPFGPTSREAFPYADKFPLYMFTKILGLATISIFLTTAISSAESILHLCEYAGDAGPFWHSAAIGSAR